MRHLLPAAVIVLGTSVATAAAQADSRIQADVSRELARVDHDAARLTVAVHDGVVMLSGTVQTLWVKQEAVKRVLKIDGVKSIMADLTIPRAENDTALVRLVADRIRQYDLYTVYDNIEGRVRNGSVRLDGAVTEPKKKADILERVAKVRGVQSIDDHLEVLPASQTDDRLRVVIANAIYRDEAFGNYSMVDPPVHVIVNNGHVTLTGFVRSQIELIKAESIARSANGVLGVDNKVQVVGRRQ